MRDLQRRMDPIECLIQHPSAPSDWNEVYGLSRVRTKQALELVRNNRAHDAWLLLCQYKGRAFLHEELEADWLNLADAMSPGYSAMNSAYEQLRLSLNDSWDEYHAVRTEDRNETEVAGISAHRDEIWAQMAVLSRRLERARARLGNSIGWHPAWTVPTPTLEEFQAVLRPDEVYLDFLWSPDGAAVLRVDRSGIASTLVDARTESRLELDARQGQRLSKGGDPWRFDSSVGEAAFGALFSSAQLVTLSPHDRLARLLELPLHGYFPYEAPIGIAPGATFIVHRRTTGNARLGTDREYLGIADHEPGGSLGGSVAETRWILDRYFQGTGRQALGAEAVRALEAPESVRLLHIACHARPGALLLDGRWLTPTDIYRWRLRANIVLLTGCDLGVGDSLMSVNSFSEAVSAITAATRADALIVSIDKVPDADVILFADLVTAALVGSEPALGWGDCGNPGRALGAAEALAWARARLVSIVPGEFAADGSGLARLSMELSGVPDGWDPSFRPIASLRSWYVLGDPAAVCGSHQATGISAPVAIPHISVAEARVALNPRARMVVLESGEEVDYYNSESFITGELGAMDVIEAHKRPSILRTDEGLYRCWINGSPIDISPSIGDAKAAMIRLLHPEAGTFDIEAIINGSDPVLMSLQSMAEKDRDDLARTAVPLTAEQVQSINNAACWFTESGAKRRLWSADRAFPISIEVLFGDPYYDMNQLDNLFLDFGDNPPVLMIRCTHLRLAARHDPAAADFIWDDKDYGRFLAQSGITVTGTRLIGEGETPFEATTCRWENASGVLRDAICWLRNDEEFWEVTSKVDQTQLEPLLASFRWLNEEFYRDLAISPRILTSRRPEDLRLLGLGD